MMNKIAIVGSSGHARVIIDIVEREGRYQIAGLLDDYRRVGEQTLGYEILGQVEALPRLIASHDLRGAIVAIGDNMFRSKVVDRIRKLCPSLPFVSAIHPSASVAKSASVAEGSAIMAGAVINPCCSIARFCILNTNASLDHDSVMEPFSSLAPGATTGGNCRIGSYAAVGIGATLINGIHIGEHTVIGAGSTVLEHVGPLYIAYGTPAACIRKRTPGEKYL